MAGGSGKVIHSMGDAVLEYHGEDVLKMNKTLPYHFIWEKYI